MYIYENVYFHYRYVNHYFLFGNENDSFLDDPEPPRDDRSEGITPRR